MLENIYDEIMAGPPELYLVNADFTDGTFEMYVFETEQAQLDWVAQLVENSREMNVDRVRYGVNLLNYTENDEWLFVVH